jgi:branched-chain amino acid transport system substrate-binding protein
MRKLVMRVWCCAMFVGLSAGIVNAQPSPLRIGVLTDMSGQFSDESGQGSVTAVKMAVEDFGGTVLGRPIDVVVGDHQNNPETAVGIAAQWYDTQNVTMVINLINSSIALAVTNVAHQKDRIAIVTGAGSSKLTNDGCTPNSIHYAYNTYSLAKGTATTLAASGGKTWFFLTADYAFGQALEADTRAVLATIGARAIGSVRYPITTTDHSSFLLQAQASGAQVVAIAGSGTTFVNAVKGAREFGLTNDSRQTLVGLLVWLSDIKALGLQAAQGMVLTNAFYWDRDTETRAFAERFKARLGRMPQMGDAADYSATMHYLNAVKAAGTDSAQAVMAKMRDTPVNDFFARGGIIRPDGQMVHDMYVYEVKKPSESKGEWDFYKLRAVIPAADAFKPLSESTCPLVHH